MPENQDSSADRPDDENPTRKKRPRIRMSARIAAVAGLSTAVIMGVVAPAGAGPVPAQSGSFNDCVNAAIVRISAEAAALPAAQRGAFISAQVALARTQCGAIITGTTTPTTTTPTTTTTTSTTTTPTTTTPTTPPPTTVTTAPGRYEITVFGLVGTGSQTITANCRTGDRLVSVRSQVPRPTGSTTSRSVNTESSGTGARLTYEVVGQVANPQVSLTIVCRSA